MDEKSPFFNPNSAGGAGGAGEAAPIFQEKMSLKNKTMVSVWCGGVLCAVGY